MLGLYVPKIYLDFDKQMYRVNIILSSLSYNFKVF
jgi:hypothetical protein